VVVDKNNNFQVISGLPSASPKTPDILPGTMPLALLRVAPYPSLSPQYAIVLNRRELSCAIRKLSNMRYTMRDIGVLKERIVNLEYYTSLSLLEKAASTMKILDENGLDRFKNGIFTDNFRDNSLTDINDSQNRIVFDPDEKTIRPLYTMNTIGFDYKGGTNVTYNSPVVTLSYSEVAFIQQKRATSDINVERQSWLFLGTVSIYPDQDVWIDTTLLKDEELNGNTLNIVVYGTGLFSATRYETDRLGPATETLDNGQVVQATINYGKFKEDSSASVNDTLVNTEWKAWQKSVTGYKVYTGQGTARRAIENGRIYSTYDEARNIANRNNVAGGPGVTIETIFKNDRIGTQYWESTGIDKMETGYKVVDVQNIPYVRPQTMLVHCRDMKPYTRMWPYFDNIPMSLYSYPLTDDQFAYMIAKAQYGLPSSVITDLSKGTRTTYNPTTGSTLPPLPSTLGTFAKPGDPLVTDVNGSLKFAMQIQSGQVRVGQRNVLVIDSSYPIDPLSVQNRTDIPVDISTGGSAIFFASGQGVSKQRTILSTKNIAYHTESISETAASSDYQSIAAPPPPAPASHSCSAYSFAVQSPNGDEGIFLTSVDIFVSRIGRQGFWCEVREMDAGQQ
ncbi:DUF4815 domain-containing protein, partial [bacterium]|nr:DUF4815 domain-containing protein [bacterium]